MITEFGPQDLEQLHLLERIASELHRCGSALRNISWGSVIRVLSTQESYEEVQSKELRTVIEIHDTRLGTLQASSIGVPLQFIDSKGQVGLIAQYNLGAYPISLLNRVVGASGMSLKFSSQPQFVWVPLPLLEYYRLHRPLADAFAQKHGCQLAAVFSVLVALSIHTPLRWRHNAEMLAHHWNLALDDAITRQQLETTVFGLAEFVAGLLDAPVSSEAELGTALHFLTLAEAKRSELSPWLEGPVHLFMQVDDAYLVDYAWVISLLYTMFFGINTDDQHFKGRLLEDNVRGLGTQALPSAPCRAADGTSRQIDSSFVVDKTLVVVECRAIGMSIGLSRGDERADQFRKNKIDKALHDASEKAAWLTTRPVGRNYRIDSRIRRICPIAVSSHVEFVPSAEPFYWLTDNKPRIMTPLELKNWLSDGTFSSDIHNVVEIPTK